MAKSRRHWYGQWLNDQLDLYSIAESLGDAAWQEEIMNALTRKEAAVDQYIRSATDPEFKALLLTISEKITEAQTLVDQERSKAADAKHRP
ncbi:hypothetical protein I8J29_10895 [Paenibacillus sp. MWE-103]|uniref:Uncharacterized protein n=1 Tax=Paenibacillus artemisiicola TaxID=1172618 RepID=A0ABS3W8T0_9BACL|nr:hypothetical protein [Paenibacillus artemisiicola]MBO7744706.1 hypothetical protein [Paenibacillus artemisiicola]